MAFIICIGCLLIVALSSGEMLANEFQRQDDVVMAKLIQLEAKVRDQDIRMRLARDEILSLKALVHQRLADVSQTAGNEAISARSPTFFIPRTCHEARESGLPQFKESGMYWIDPDGPAIGEGAIVVDCDMATGATSVSHDSETTIDIPKCTSAGCYSRPIVYNGGSLQQIKALAELSANCHQTIQVNCLGGPFTVGGIDYAWWNDVNGRMQTFWTGSDESVHTCQCGVENDCVRSDLQCNCDANVAVPLSDSGNVTLKRVLPVTRLTFGQIDHNGGSHTLGKLTCSGKSTYRYASSCADLWRIGYTFNGLYPVRGSKRLEFVHCDFSMGQDVVQETVGFANVKTQPIEFYVQRSNSLTPSGQQTISFDIEQLNEGGAMNVASGIFTVPKSGTYLFDFSGVSDPVNGVFSVVFYVNDEKKASTLADNVGQLTINLPSIWHLTEGSTVKLTMSSGTLYSDNKNGPLVHFTGILLEEDIFAP